MRLAFENPEGTCFEFTDALRREGIAASRESPRRRMLLPIHREQGDLVQRMVNFLQPGSYVRPHLHPREGASETLVVLSGRLGFVLFESDGAVRSVHELGPGDLLDIVPHAWHSVLALEPDTVIGEFKRGPYDEEDKVFADWAPAEGDPEAADYLRSMERRFETGTGKGEAAPRE